MSPCTRGGLNECASTALYVGAIANAHSRMPHQIRPSKMSNEPWLAFLHGFVAPVGNVHCVCVCVCVLYKRFLHINNLNTIAGRLQRSGWLQDNWR